MHNRIIICGSRDFCDTKIFNETMKNLRINAERSDIEIISGHARGADRMGEIFAKENNIRLKIFPAQWDKYGKSAGYRRNDQMLQYALQEHAIVIAFWDGTSRGTKHMIDTSRRIGAEVHVITYKPMKG